ncbi:MAG: hypothetical protein IPL67_16460 [Ignavibacteria bacterium]|nr:hypothetical protein [Ignavibacteria bacterium]
MKTITKILLLILFCVSAVDVNAQNFTGREFPATGLPGTWELSTNNGSTWQTSTTNISYINGRSGHNSVNTQCDIAG